MAPNRIGIARGGRNGAPRGDRKAKRERPVAFRSSRLEEPASADSDSDVDSVQDEGSLSDDSSSEDTAAQPDFYNMLLQDLKSVAKSSKPPKKRRKLLSGKTAPLSLGDEDDVGTAGPTKEPQEKDAADEMEEEDAKDLVVSETIEDEPAEDDDDMQDPFELHYASVTGEIIAPRIAEMKAGSLLSNTGTFSSSLKVTFTEPASGAMGPAKSGGGLMNKADEAPYLKGRLRSRAKQTLDRAGNDVQLLSKSLFNYQDVLFCSRKPENAEDLRLQICLHALNHVLKTRDKVIKDNARLAKADPDDQTEYRDQGFTRPKVLILLPTRQACVRFVETLIDLFGPEQQENKSRFNESFSLSDDVLSAQKPRDFQDLFGGNDDDIFRLGVKITRKTIKFFSHFYNSDFIFASPLGLRMAIGSADSKDFDRDFLSSIEVVAVDHADAMLMQNWEHVSYVLEHLNAQPQEAHGCDFSRVREWYLDGNAKYLRQTIVVSSFNSPDVNQIFNRNMLNVAGKNKISNRSFEGVIGDLGIHVKQTFSRFDAATPQSEPDARFKYFTNTVFTTLKKYARPGSGRSAGVLLFIPSYIDFVRVRNFLASSVMAQDISFGALSEYTSVSETARARSHFFYGRHSVLLYTGRAHHFRRYKIRGVKRVLMYALPDNPFFYQEIAGGFLTQSASEGLVDPGNAVVQSVFSKWDVMKLERVAGTSRVAAMIGGKGSTFDFV